MPSEAGNYLTVLASKKTKHRFASVTMYNGVGWFGIEEEYDFYGWIPIDVESFPEHPMSRNVLGIEKITWYPADVKPSKEGRYMAKYKEKDGSYTLVGTIIFNNGEWIGEKQFFYSSSFSSWAEIYLIFYSWAEIDGLNG